MTAQPIATKDDSTVVTASRADAGSPIEAVATRGQSVLILLGVIAFLYFAR